MITSLLLAGGINFAHAESNCDRVAIDPTKLSVGRIVEVDTSTGAVLGKFTKLHHEQSFLAPNEVVLTFDDGPMPWITRSILATLAHHCTRATFFSVGKMAMAYPNVLREVLDQGHTVGTHTWSHPLNLKRLAPDAALNEIERGFAAVTAAAGRPIAPFFRFPGLSDSTSMVAYLAQRHVASFTVDVVSNDSFIADPARLAKETLAKVDANHGGIILFHDIKAATAKALPVILDALANRGYSVVHMVPKQAMQPRHDLVAGFEPQVAKLVASNAQTSKTLLPFYGSVGPEPVLRSNAPSNKARGATGSIDRAPIVTFRANDAVREDTRLEEAGTSISDDVDAGQRSDGRYLQTGTRGWSTSIRRSLPN